MVIQHNMEASNANNQLNKTENAMQLSMGKLSSGYRINTAADDAAGLKISEKMRSQIRGLAKARTNAEDGISLVQTADGALQEVHSMLQRMNELCVQAINDTNTDFDRESMQEEIVQLKTEIDRVADSTTYNNIKLLNGDIAYPGRNEYNSMLREQRLAEIQKSMGSYNTGQVYTALNGAQAGQKLTRADVDSTEGVKIVYIEDPVVTTTQTPSGDPTSTDAKFTTLKSQLKNEIVPQAVNALLSTYSQAFGDLAGSSIGIGLKLAGNSEMGSTTLAAVSLSWSQYSDNTVVPDMLSYQLKVNTDALTLDSSGDLDADSRKELEVTIVHEMMHAFMDEVLTNGMTGTVNNVVSNDEFPKWFKEGMAQTAAGGYYDNNDWMASMGINTSASDGQISSALAKYPIGGSDNECNYGTGYLACMYLGYLAGGKQMDANALTDGLDTVLNEIKSGKSLADEVKNLTGYNSLNAFQNSFATDKNVISFVKELTAFVGGGTGGAVGVIGAGGSFKTPNDILPDAAPNPAVSLFALNIDYDTVKNQYPAGYTVFGGGSATNGKGSNGSGTNGGASGPSGTTNHNGKGLNLHVGANPGEASRVMIYIDAMNTSSIGVANVDVSTGASANLSLEMVALAINQVSAQRSELGAYQNRLEYTINNLANIRENAQTSESVIRDTDMADEMVNYSATSIIAQAGQSVLAQGNKSKQEILTLLGA